MASPRGATWMFAGAPRSALRRSPARRSTLLGVTPLLEPSSCREFATPCCLRVTHHPAAALYTFIRARSARATIPCEGATLITAVPFNCAYSTCAVTLDGSAPLLRHMAASRRTTLLYYPRPSLTGAHMRRYAFVAPVACQGDTTALLYSAHVRLFANTVPSDSTEMFAHCPSSWLCRVFSSKCSTCLRHVAGPQCLYSARRTVMCCGVRTMFRTSSVLESACAERPIGLRLSSTVPRPHCALHSLLRLFAGRLLALHRDS
jgi:hypothetical protein